MNYIDMKSSIKTFGRQVRHITNPVSLLTMLIVFTSIINVKAEDMPYVSAKKAVGSFTLASAGKSAPIFASSNDYEGVMIALKSFQADVKAVTGNEPALSVNNVTGKKIVIVGTIGISPVIDKLIKDKKINAAGIKGKWEVFLSQVVKNPMPGVESALVIAGSDKRGTIYGIYDLSSQIGVSPWYWWGDVPIKHQSNLYVLAGRHTDGEPAVKYRGIFINDEGPSFLSWAKEKFSGANTGVALNGKIMDNGVNHAMYAHMFELLLRLKANFLWPAMWANAFNDDDKENPILADKYGIVMGTSHHEPMTRAQKEWGRYNGEFTEPEKKAWNYATNSDVLKEYWKKGIERSGNKEVLVTVGMRGDGDSPMATGGAKANMALLDKIIKDQRASIAEVTHKDPSKTPQVWALYKEVQDYFDAGLRVPEDITMLYCDDNWGNVRRLPNLNDPKRSGGYGIYYHFDYHGGPRNYQWVNSNPLPHTWEQMHLAYEYGVRQEWIVNVGDLKPLEFPISFFLDYAWNPNKYPANSLEKYTKDWVTKQFGPDHAAEIAYIISTYGKYNGRRKPELVAPTLIRSSVPYSLTDYREFETVVADFNKLRNRAKKLAEKIPAEYKDAYYELVLHPVIASANFNEMFLASAKKKWYGDQGRTSANDEAKKADMLFARDAEISKYYNDTLARGKWSHMMDEIHIGYMTWTEPRANKLPAFVNVDAPAAAEMGVSVEGSASWWPNETTTAVLPELSKYPNMPHYIDVFNRGQASFDYTAEASAPYVQVSPKSGKINAQERLWVSVDWLKAPKGTHQVPVIITGANGAKVTVQVPVNNSIPKPISGFVLSNGYASMECIHFSKMVNSSTVKWNILPDYGRTLSAIAAMPVTAPRQTLSANSPHLEYEVNIADTGMLKIRAFVAPSIDFTHEKGLWYGISIDNEAPQKVNIDPLIEDPRRANTIMEAASANDIKELVSKHHITKPGKHIVKYWLIDPAIVLEKLVVDAGGVKPSYLGPPESYYKVVDKTLVKR